MRNGKVMILVAVLALVLTPVLASASVVETATAKGKPVNGDTCDPTLTGEPCVVPLFAGQYIPVGTVTVSRDDMGNVTVTYQITDEDWYIVETHLYVDQYDPPPTTAPGQFPYKHENLDYVYSDVYELGHFDPEACLYVAAHAVVVTAAYPDLSAFEYSLPEQVSMSVQYPYAGGPSYFQTTVLNDPPTILDGTYNGWCIDTDNTILQELYTANVYSSYESLPDGILEHPENLDLVNWIINQGFVGAPSPSCGGNYTYGDVQLAIWTLIDDQTSTAGLGSYSMCRVNEIIAAALESGEGFIPSCGDQIAVILVPVDGAQVTIAQVTLFEFPAEIGCGDLWTDETAWGQGGCPFDKGWGSYFKCCPPEEECAVFAGKFSSGESVEGWDAVLDGVSIQALPGPAVAIFQSLGAPDPVYGAPNYGSCGSSEGFPTHGCLGEEGGFSDYNAQAADGAHDYTFFFAEPVNGFKLRMLDYGDYNPTTNANHLVTMTAYNESVEVVTIQELSYTSQAAQNPSSGDFGDMACPALLPTDAGHPGGSGDACSAAEGEPGNYLWEVTGSGIVKVTLTFGSGPDPKIGFKDMCLIR